MSIASGYRKFNRFMKQADGTYIKMSHWTSSNTVHFDDGSTVQANLGAIKGITSDLACEDTNVAASMPAVSAKLTELNNGFDIIDIKSSYFQQNDCAIWIEQGIHIITLQYSITGTDNIYVYLYNYTDATSIGYAYNIDNPIDERGDIVRMIKIDKSIQVGCHCVGNISDIGYQISDLKIK